MSASSSFTKKLTEKISCKLEVLTPVHVGAALSWNEGIEFVQKNGKVYIIDIERYFEKLMNTSGRGNRNGYEELISMLNAGKAGDVGELCNQLDIDLKDISTKVYAVSSPTHNQIKPLIRTGMGTAYIPGSSIKGAIRSVLFNFMYNQAKRPEFSRFTEGDLIGTFDKAVTRYIHSFDVELPQTGISNLRTFNLYLRGYPPRSDYKQNLPLTIEHFVSGAAADFRLAVDEQWVEKLSRNFQHLLPPNMRHFITPGRASIPHLFNLINEYTFTHLNREIEFLHAYPQAEDTDFIIENLENLRRMAANNANSCILRLGFGGGFHSITGDWRFPDHTETIQEPDWKNKKGGEPTRYKTRKVAGQDMDSALMGFVKITLPEGYERIKFQTIPDAAMIAKVPKGQNRNTLQEDKPVLKTPQITIKIELPKLMPKSIKYDEIEQGSIIFAKVIRIAKPFSDVELMIEDYPFENKASMSGVRGVIINEGDVVEVRINSRNKEGKINTVVLNK